jgi:hypothetical protein
VLGHRALPPRASQEPCRSVERVADHLAVHMVPRAPTAPAPPSRIVKGARRARAARDGKDAKGAKGE